MLRSEYILQCGKEWTVEQQSKRRRHLHTAVIQRTRFWLCYKWRSHQEKIGIRVSQERHTQAETKSQANEMEGEILPRCFSSVEFSHSVVSDSLQPHGLQHTRLPCPSPTPGAYSNSHPLSPWCHPTISSSVIPFSSCLQSFPASGSFQTSQFFASGGQSIGASASASVLPMNIQDWFPLGWTGWISLLSKGFSRVFSNTTVQKHQLHLLFFAFRQNRWRLTHAQLFQPCAGTTEYVASS